MAVVAQGEIEVRLSKASATALEKELAGVTSKAGTKAAGELTKPSGALGKLEAGLKNFAQNGATALNPIGLLQKGAGGLAVELEKLGPVGLAAGAGLVAFGALAEHGVSQFTHLADQVHTFSTISGASAQDASKFVVALNELGVSSDSVARGISRLARQSADGAEPLKEFGIQVARNRDGSFNAIGTFDKLADRIQATTDASTRNAIAFKAFGRAGVELIPILSRGSAELKQFEKLAQLRGEVFSEKDLEAARNYEIAVRGLGDSFHAFEIQAGKAAVPFLTLLTETVTNDLDHLNRGFREVFGGHLLSGFRDLADAIGGSNLPKATTDLTALAKAEEQFGQSSKDSKNSVDDAANSIAFFQDTVSQSLLQANLKDFTASAIGAASALSTDAKTGVTDFSKALSLLDPIAARVAQDETDIALGLDPLAHQFDLSAAAADQFSQALALTLTPFENAQQASINLDKAEADLTKTLKDHGPNVDKVTKATIGLDTAQAELDKKQKSGKATALELSAAHLKVTEAQARLTAAQKETGSTQDDIRESTLKLVQSLQANEEALVRDSNGSISAKQAKDQLLASIDAEIKKYPGLRAELGKYRDQIVATPDSKLIDFRQQGLSTIQGSLDTLNATLVELTKVFEIKFGIDPNSIDKAVADAKAEFDKTGFVLAIPGARVVPSAPAAPGAPAGTVGLVPGGGINAAPAPQLGETAGQRQARLQRERRGRQRGGPVLAGEAYPVGERGWEWFVPDRNGTILPHGQNPPRGEQTVFNIYDRSGSPEVTARMVSARQGRNARR